MTHEAAEGRKPNVSVPVRPQGTACQPTPIFAVYVAKLQVSRNTKYTTIWTLKTKWSHTSFALFKCLNQHPSQH